MNEEKATHKDLKIPAPVSDRADVIQGIGNKEISIILATLAVLIIMVIVGSNITGNVPACMFTAMFVLALTVVTVKRDATNENLIDHARNVIHYLKMQKAYEYRHYDIYNAHAAEEAGNAGEKTK